jgi:aspartate aminotransferase-like enzyme
MTMLLSAIPPVIATTLEESYGHHRTRWFDAILDRVGSWVTRAGGGGTPLILTATASGSREAIVANLVAPGDPVWLTADSVFRPHVEVARGVCRLLDPDSPRLGDTHSPLVLLDDVNASGTVLDLTRVTAAVRATAPDALVVLDSTISLGADRASLDGAGIDGFLVSPDGAMMGIPGLAIVVASDRLLNGVRDCRPGLRQRPFYFDLLRYAKTWPKRTTPYSPNISAAVAFAKAIELIDANGGLAEHVRRHAARASSVRAALSAATLDVHSGPAHTNAYTILEVAASSREEIRERLAEIGVATVPLGGGRLRLDHVGWVAPGALDRACAALGEVASGVGAARVGTAGPAGAPAAGVADFELARAVPPNIPADEPVGIFEIPASELVAQAREHARREGGGRDYETRIEAAARATFRSAPRVDLGTVRGRTVGFIGAGRIVAHAVERCRAIGITSLVVCSPSLAARARVGDRGEASDRSAPAYWEARGATVARRPEDVWTAAHTIVLLPWFYDAEALGCSAGRPST